jgi:hypothetical protein
VIVRGRSCTTRWLYIVECARKAAVIEQVVECARKAAVIEQHGESCTTRLHGVLVPGECVCVFV